jgi:hypothetical protein
VTHHGGRVDRVLTYSIDWDMLPEVLAVSTFEVEERKVNWVVNGAARLALKQSMPAVAGLGYISAVIRRGV